MQPALSAAAAGGSLQAAVDAALALLLTGDAREAFHQLAEFAVDCLEREPSCAGRELAGASGVVAAVVGTMRAHAEDLALVLVGCKALGNLCSSRCCPPCAPTPRCCGSRAESRLRGMRERRAGGGCARKRVAHHGASWRQLSSAARPCHARPPTALVCQPAAAREVACAALGVQERLRRRCRGLRARARRAQGARARFLGHLARAATAPEAHRGDRLRRARLVAAALDGSVRERLRAASRQPKPSPATLPAAAQRCRPQSVPPTPLRSRLLTVAS
jgi:hypothetical protein